MTMRRIHITGGQGSGKTTLATRLHDITGAPLHGLDLVARVGGGNGLERPAAERDALIAAIAATDEWITEGVHLGWTAPLLDRADAIVWLDHISPTEASGRMVRRFLAGAVREFRTRRGRERFMRMGDYLRHVRHLGGALRHARSANDPDLFAASLAAWSNKLVHCATAAEVEAFVDGVAAAASGLPAATGRSAGSGGSADEAA